KAAEKLRHKQTLMAEEKAQQANTQSAPQTAEKPMDVQFAYKQEDNGQLKMDESNKDDKDEQQSDVDISFQEKENDEYILPAITLLKEPKSHSQQKEKSQINQTAEILE